MSPISNTLEELTTPSGMNPIDLAIAQLLGKPSPNVEWLRRAGPIAKRLNREAQLENERRTVSGVEDHGN